MVKKALECVPCVDGHRYVYTLLLQRKWQLHGTLAGIELNCLREKRVIVRAELQPGTRLLGTRV